MTRAHRMIFQYHERFGQWHVPNLKAYVPHERGYFVVRTNRWGMRSSREYPLTADPSVCRILLFGDSFTGGEGVHNEERFSDLMERQLPGVEVLNFGLDGSGIDQQLLILEELADPFGGDVILLCPLVENIRRVALPFWPVLDRTSGDLVFLPKPYFSLQEDGLHLHHVPVPRQRPTLSEIPEAHRRQAGLLSSNGFSLKRFVGLLLGPLKPIVWRWSHPQPFPQYDGPDTPEWQLTRALLKRAIARAGGRTVVLAPLPMFYHIEGISPPNYLKRYQELVHEHPSVHLVDLLPYFHALPKQDRRACRYPQDVHYTALGHQVVAEALCHELAHRGLLRRPMPVS